MAVFDNVEVQPLRDLVDPFGRTWEVASVIFTLFGALALSVATFGLYSVLSHEVAARVPEIAIRAAVGAGRWNLLSLVATRAVGLTLAGVGLGLAVATVASPFLAPFLYRADPRALWSFAGAAGLLLVVATAAALLPALRASGTDPASVLRH